METKTLDDEVLGLYNRLKRNSKFAKYYKVDLHIHTPASKDYKKTATQNDNDAEYKFLVQRFIETDVDIFAITDHNSIDGYFNIQKTLDEYPDLKAALGKKLILPGVEITCYGKHFIAIFPENISKEKLKILLLECGIDSLGQGNENESADRVTPLTLCEKIESFEGLVLIAHCDAENGLLEGYFNKNRDEIKGNSIIKVLKSQAVYGVCYNSPNNLDRLKDLLRSFQLDRMHILQASDSHSSLPEYIGSGVPLGTRASWIKLGQLSFRALSLALKNPNNPVYNEPVIESDNPVILGVAIKGGFIKQKDGSSEWAVIPLASELNCIIGARGTGKSTFLDILRYVFDFNNKDLGKSIINRFTSIIVFIKEEWQTKAIYFEPTGLSKRIIKQFILGNNLFEEVKRNRKNNKSLIQTNDNQILSNLISYRQKDLLYLAVRGMGPSLLVESLCHVLFGPEYINVNMKYDLYKENIILHARDLRKERILDKNADLTSDYMQDQFSKYLKMHQKRLDLQKETIKALNKVLDGKLKLSYTFSIPKKVYENIIQTILKKERYHSNLAYEHEVKQRKLLTHLFQYISSDEWALPFYLFTGNYKMISQTCNASEQITKPLCARFSKHVDPVDVPKLPHLIIEFELNVNHGISNKPLYVKREFLSFGQKAVGMLLLILHGATELGEDRPLLIDQPEDDLDNSYIYHTLVREFHGIQDKRQLIIATHNPNIPIAGDAENILVFSSDGKNGWLDQSGTIENKNVADKVLQILEGDFEAFSRRAEKYGFKLEKTYK